MADPVLDEDNILGLLQLPITIETVNAIQAGAAQALIDLFDRKVTRQEFMDEASTCLSLYGQTAKLWMLASMERAHHETGIDEMAFRRAEEGITKLIGRDVDRVVTLVKRLQECPLSEDKVH